MKKQLFRRILSMAAAAAMACGSFGSAADGCLAAALKIQQETETEIQQSVCEPVSVIVTLNSDAVMCGADDASYLITSEAAAAEDAVAAGQDAVIAQIKALYPELEVRTRLTTLVNAFSCSLPENLIETVQALPGVSDVSCTGSLEIRPQLAAASRLGGFPAFSEATGCTGEGKVIAFIDTELDVTHPMFAPLGEEIGVRLEKSDVEEICSGIGLHTAVDPESAYISSKIPFAVIYNSRDPYKLSNQNNYHGTHVCGIAAGNRITDEEGMCISGIAPDAQIVFMGMGLIFRDDSEAFLAAAIEDAVKLQADVINMSLSIDGEKTGQSILADAVNAAEEAGVTVCIAAGNSDNGTIEYKETHTPDNPDVSWINGLITDDMHALAVASADNAVMVPYQTMLCGGRRMICMGCIDDYNTSVQHLSKVLGSMEYPYEYCGTGSSEDYDGRDMHGKIALVECSEQSYDEIAGNARRAGVVGVIVIQRSGSDPVVITSSSELLLTMISQEDGAFLKDAERKYVSFLDETTGKKPENKVSTYSAWGVHASMELRPDIMGIGGQVRSAGYNSTTQVLQGTSMASPYIAGCVALLDQHLDESGCTRTGAERERYMRNLLMSTAVPYQENDMFVTPRRQGSGLVQVNRAIYSKVILTGAEGESKISLRDRLGTEFSFPLTLTNISNEAVAFADARIALTTDGVNSRGILEGQQPLACTAELDHILQLAPGESRTETVTVRLDAAQDAALRRSFVNGYFIEGYLLLEGAENSSDISVPMVGFSDDFSALPVFSNEMSVNQYIMDYLPMNATVPLCKRVSLLSQALARIDDNELLEMQRNIRLRGCSAVNAGDILSDYATDAERAGMTAQADTIYCSPNHDGLADLFSVNVNVKRACEISGPEIVDSSGIVYYAGPDAGTGSKGGSSLVQEKRDISRLPDGDYTVRIRANINSESSHSAPQTYDIPLCIDRTAPVISSEIEEKYGRKILHLEASDEALDGIAVFGIGSGGIEGRYVLGQKNRSGLLPLALAGYFARSFSSNLQNAIQNGQKAGSESVGKNCEPALLNRNYLSTDSEYEYWWDTYDEQHVFGRFLLDGRYVNDYNLFDYAEFIPAEPDEDGVFRLPYDITDLGGYDFVAIDRALNISSYGVMEELMNTDTVKPGIYVGNSGLYVFTEQTMQYYSFMDETVRTAMYWLYQSEMSISWDSMGISGIDLVGLKDGSLLIRGDLMYWTEDIFQDSPVDWLRPLDITDPESYLAFHGYAAEMNYLLPNAEEYTNGEEIMQTNYTLLPEAVVVYEMEYIKENGSLGTLRYELDLKTGDCILPDGTGYNFLTGTALGRTGDVNCDSTVDVADAVLLARVLAEDRTAVITAEGRKHADCNHNSRTDSEDVVMILRAIARLITLR